MVTTIGANTQNTLLPTLDGLNLLGGNSPTSTANLSPTAANDFGPAVIISLSAQALEQSPLDQPMIPATPWNELIEPPTPVGSGIAIAIGHTIDDNATTITDSNNIERLFEILAKDNLQFTQLDASLDDHLALLLEPDAITNENGKALQHFSKEKVVQGAKVLMRLREIVGSRNDPAVLGRAYGAIAKINESPLGKAIGAMQAQTGTDLEGLAAFMENLPPGQALDYSDDNTVLVTGERPTAPAPPSAIDNGFQIMPIPTDIYTGFSVQDVVTVDFASPILTRLGIDKVTISLAKFGHIILDYSGLNKAKGIFANDLQNYDAMNRLVLLPVLANPNHIEIQGAAGRVSGLGQSPLQRWLGLEWKPNNYSQSGFGT